MHEVSFEEAVEFIRLTDPRYQRDAYLFVREALDRTQAALNKAGRGEMRHVSGQQLLEGIREHGLAQFGPMAMTVFEDWGVHACGDFGEIVFNMVETRTGVGLAPEEIRDLPAFATLLKEHADPVSELLWNLLPDAARQAVREGKDLEANLVTELNTISRTVRIYEAKRFAGVKLSDQATALSALDLHGVELAQFNRLLLEDAYPEHIVRSHGLLARTAQDSRADFSGGYDFFEALRTPFLPSSKQPPPNRGQKPARAQSR